MRLLAALAFLLSPGLAWSECSWNQSAYDAGCPDPRTREQILGCYRILSAATSGCGQKMADLKAKAKAAGDPQEQARYHREMIELRRMLKPIDALDDDLTARAEKITGVGGMRATGDPMWHSFTSLVNQVMVPINSAESYFELIGLDPDKPEPLPDPSRAKDDPVGGEQRVERGRGSPEAKAVKLTEVGKQHLQDERPAGAERAADKALSHDPRSPDALVVRGMAKSQQGDYQGALDDAEAALKGDPANEGARQLKGFASQALRGKVPSKLALKGPNFGADRDDAGGGSGGRADFAREGGGSSLAAGDIPVSGAIPLSRQLAVAAERKLGIGDYKGAILDLTKALQQLPDDPVLWRLRAIASNKLKNWEGALHDADEALKRAPNDVFALLARAEAHYGLGNFQLAFADADRAAKLDPKNGFARYWRALALEKLGRLDEAARDLEEAMRLDPSLKPLCMEALARIRPGSAVPEKKGLQLPWWRWLAGLFAALLIAWPVGKKVAGWTTRPPAEPAPEPEAPQEPPAVDNDAPAPRPSDWAQRTLQAGVVLAKVYRIDAELGRGGMGVVYRAFDQVLQRDVAIKQLRRQDPSSNEELERFLKEARVVAQLRHPNLVEIYNVVQEESEIFLVFDLIRGRSLDKVLLDMRRLSLDQTRRVVSEVCAALAHAHERRVIHRDLKPANILLGDDGHCRVMDFGIAHQSRSATGPTFTGAWGTPPYMAPEQIMGQVSKESDLYAVGALAYELLTGAVPFTGPDLLSLKTTGLFPPATELTPGLPEGTDPFFQKALHPEPGKRFRSAAELGKAFSDLGVRAIS